LLDSLLGYSFTIAITIALVTLIAAIVCGRKELIKELKGINRYSIAAIIGIVAVFLAIAIFYTTAFEELYFDENIYQGIAINILKHGQMLWCTFGTGYLNNCYITALYHDPAGWSYFLAIAFAIFGIGTSTSYDAQLFIGALSLPLLFLFAYVLTKKNSIAVVSAYVLALMPELYIWSRTQADPDLPFMTFSILSFFFFFVFLNIKSRTSLLMFVSSLVIVLYMRTEAILLVGVFFLIYLLYNFTGLNSIKRNIAKLFHIINTDYKVTIIVLFFILLTIPQIIYIAIQASNPQYGQQSNQSVISLANFKHNLGGNLKFLFGSYNYSAYFPAVSTISLLIFSLIGIVLLAFEKSSKAKVLSASLLWFLTYFLFYTSFYAGSATFGVDVRFMLQILPPLSLLSGIGIVLAAKYISELPYLRFHKRARHEKHFPPSRKTRRKEIFQISVAALILLLGVAYPFYAVSNLINLKVSQMPQQSVIAPTIRFFYSNYSKVPSNCLVFSFTPDIWYEVGRASAQIGYLGLANSTIVNLEKNFSCFVLDYGYWCMVPPYNSTQCLYDKNAYKTIVLSEGSIPYTDEHPAFYLLKNYTP